MTARRPPNGLVDARFARICLAVLQVDAIADSAAYSAAKVVATAAQAARASAAAAASRKRKVTAQPVYLLLGMTQPSPVELREATTRLFTSAEWRDYNRVCEMRRLGATVYTLSLVQRDEPTHFDMHISRRGAIEVSAALNSVGLTSIHLDYYRFPEPYMRQAYECIDKFVTELQHKGCLAAGCRLLVPVPLHGPRLLTQLPGWSCSPVTQGANALATAADAIEGGGSLSRISRLGGYSHEAQLSCLRKVQPFDCWVLGEQP